MMRGLDSFGEGGTWTILFTVLIPLVLGLHPISSTPALGSYRFNLCTDVGSHLAKPETHQAHLESEPIT